MELTMEQEHQLTVEAQRGIQARDLMEHPLLMEAFRVMEQAYHQAWLNSNDIEEREKQWMKTKLLAELKEQLERVLTTGKMAQQQLNNHLSFLERFGIGRKS